MKLKALIITAMAAFTLLATPALAIELAEAKAQGLVGEQPNGYLGVVKTTSGVQALVDDVNAKRRAVYQKIAADNKIELTAVEARAGQRAIEQTEPGHYVRTPSGWQKK